MNEINLLVYNAIKNLKTKNNVLSEIKTDTNLV